MKKLNAIDLDNTLVPFDSFRLFALEYLKAKKYLSPVLLIILLRKIRLLGAKRFKASILRYVRADPLHDFLIDLVVTKATLSFDTDVMARIKAETDADTVNVLLSAAASDYVVRIATHLHWECIASDFRNGHFVHAYGVNKSRLLTEAYPPPSYKYHYAISDSYSDLPLLAKFESHELLRRHNKRRN